jgi:hypothetical protein
MGAGRFGQGELANTSQCTARLYHIAGCSFDHLVRAGEQRRGNGSANSFGGPQVHNQLEPRRTLNWYIGGMGTFEDFVYINSDAPHDFDRVRTI